jgi:hypothetical protein
LTFTRAICYRNDRALVSARKNLSGFAFANAARSTRCARNGVANWMKR